MKVFPVFQTQVSIPKQNLTGVSVKNPFPKFMTAVTEAFNQNITCHKLSKKKRKVKPFCHPFNFPFLVLAFQD